MAPISKVNAETLFKRNSPPLHKGVKQECPVAQSTDLSSAEQEMGSYSDNLSSSAEKYSSYKSCFKNTGQTMGHELLKGVINGSQPAYFT